MVCHQMTSLLYLRDLVPARCRMSRGKAMHRNSPDEDEVVEHLEQRQVRRPTGKLGAKQDSTGRIEAARAASEDSPHRSACMLLDECAPFVWSLLAHYAAGTPKWVSKQPSFPQSTNRRTIARMMCPSGRTKVGCTCLPGGSIQTGGATRKQGQRALRKESH